MQRGLFCMAVVTLAAFSGSCGHVKTTRTTPQAQRIVAKDATRDDLIDKYNTIANGIEDLKGRHHLARRIHGDVQFAS